MEDKFDELYNKILDGEGDWDYSTLDELLSLSEAEGREKGQQEIKTKAIDAWNTAMIFYTSPACPKEEEALQLFIKGLDQPKNNECTTQDEKAEQYSAKLCNQSGNHTIGEIETAYVTGYNEAEQEAIKAFDMYLRNYYGLDVAEQRYTALMNDFTNIMRGTLIQP